MQYIKLALPLAVATGALANPLFERGDSGACLAAVTGKAALGDDKLRADDCKSYMTTTITPAPITVTSTVTAVDATTTSGWEKWKRGGNEVYVCPNQVPKYASACDDAGYSSACSKYGHGSAVTTTVAPTTTTATVFVPPTGDCKSSGAATVTVTVTASASSTSAAPTCLTSDKADYFVNSFKNFLEYTNYNGNQAPAGRGFNTDLANKVLAEDFQDISDSINFMASIPLGSVTFDGRDAFIGGQGSQPEVAVTILNTFYSCDSITFRYSLSTFAGANLPVQGVNYMQLTEDLSQVKTQYAEFSNAAWLTNLGNPQCAAAAAPSSK